MMLASTGLVIGYLVATAISVGVGALGSLLSSKKQPVNSFKDQPPQLASRGAWIPRLFGTRRVGAVITWVGKRFTKKASSGGGGSFGGLLGGGSSGLIYYESGMHVICVGPAYQLYEIRKNNGIIWRSTTCTRLTTPSGTTLTTNDGEDFQIFWGEEMQPINTYPTIQYTQTGTSTKINIHSRWPRHCYIIHHSVKLGGSPSWPTFDYTIMSKPESSPDPLVDSSPYMVETSGSVHNNGANPAHVLWELLTSPYPHGAGLIAGDVDKASFESVGVLLDAEQYPMNILVENGDQMQNVVGDILKEAQLFMVQVGGKITLYAMRPVPDGTTLPEIVPDINVDPYPEETKQHGALMTDMPVFTFSNRNIAFQNDTVPLANDARSRRGNLRRQTTEIQLYGITDQSTAYLVAKRRMFEFTSNVQAYNLASTRNTRDPTFHPGKPFIVTGVGQMRLINKQLADTSSKVQISAIFDYYSLGNNIYLPPVDDDSAAAVPIPVLTPATDIVFKPFNVPSALGGGSGSFMVPRIRANTDTTRAAIWVCSTSGGVYNLLGSQSVGCTGGLLTNAMTALDADGLSKAFDIEGPDIDNVVDLTGNDDAYFAGAQLALCGDELMLIRALSAVTSTNYTADDILRGAFGTTKANHAIGDVILIFQLADMTLLRTPLLASAVTLYVKSVPTIGSSSVSIAGVTDKSLVGV